MLFETTAGSGNALGASFEQLAELIAIIDTSHRERIGVCVDTCHIWAAGYDLRSDYDGVMQTLSHTIGLTRVQLFHLNDSVGGLNSRRDRHAHISEGMLGRDPFARLLDVKRFAPVPKVIETPKDADVVAADRKNLAELRAMRAKSRAIRYDSA